MGVGKDCAANFQVWETSESTPSSVVDAKANTWLCIEIALSAKPLL